MPSPTRAPSPPSTTSSRVRLSYQGLCPNSSCKRFSGFVTLVMAVSSTLECEQLTRPRGDVLSREAELLHHAVAGGGRAVVIDRDGVVGVLVPAEADAGL